MICLARDGIIPCGRRLILKDNGSGTGYALKLIEAAGYEFSVDVEI